MKDSVKKFREEAKKLEETDALKDARKKYVTKKLVKLIKTTKIIFLNHKRE